MNLIRIQSRLTLEMAVNQQAKSIAWLRIHRAAELEEVIMQSVALLAKSLNVHKNLDGEQILEISMLLIEKYFRLRPEEILYVFKKAKTGEYGPVDYSLDIVKICIWIDKYIEEERFPYFERMSENYSKSPEEFTALTQALTEGAQDSRLLQQLNLPQQKLLK